MAQDDLRVIVIGFNDREAGDGSVGGVILSQLEKTIGVACEFRAIEGNCPPGMLAEIPADALVLFIRAMQSDSPPGTVHCFKLPSKSAHRRHDVLDSSLQAQIEEIKRDKGVAPKMFLIGVEVDTSGPPGELSEPAKKAVAEIVRNFPRYLKLARDLTA